VRVARALRLEGGSTARPKTSDVVAHFFRDEVTAVTGSVAVAVLAVVRSARAIVQLVYWWQPAVPDGCQTRTGRADSCSERAHPTGQSWSLVHDEACSPEPYSFVGAASEYCGLVVSAGGGVCVSAEQQPPR
jgi:hypothetical protein